MSSLASYINYQIFRPDSKFYLGKVIQMDLVTTKHFLKDHPEQEDDVYLHIDRFMNNPASYMTIREYINIYNALMYGSKSL